MERVSVKIGELIDAFEWCSIERLYYLDTGTGEIIFLSELDEAEEREKMSGQMDKQPGRYLQISEQDSRQGYNDMADFTTTEDAVTPAPAFDPAAGLLRNDTDPDANDPLFVYDPVSDGPVSAGTPLEVTSDLGARVLILDEPTTGISADQRELLFHTLRELASDGMIVIFVSHKLEEVEEICEEVTVMRQGRVVAQGTHETLLETSEPYRRIFDRDGSQSPSPAATGDPAMDQQR